MKVAKINLTFENNYNYKLDPWCSEKKSVNKDEFTAFGTY
jgi:hypothetical protein